MQQPQESAPRRPSPFVAAFLSLVFPGLGHAYAGAYRRGLAFAAVPILGLALVGGVVLRMDRLQLLGFVVQPLVLQSILALDVLFFAYRLLATVDAWRVARYLDAYAISGEGRLGLPRLSASPFALAGLIAVVLVMSGAHVAVANYDLEAMRFVNCVFDQSGTADCSGSSASASPSPTVPGASAGASASASAASPSATIEATPVPSAFPPPSAAAGWDGKSRLNILLIGVDQRPNEGTFNTDTLLVVSVDPTTGHVAMFTLPRDTVDVPVPAGPARAVFGATYYNKVNSWWTANHLRSDLWSGTDLTRGFNALKAMIGNLYGLDIQYYAEVNFGGFKQVVDTLGGVTVNVQVPVTDDDYPGDNGAIRVYIPTGVQHMDGAQALIYARSRHASSDFDRGERQQRVLLSLKEQTNIGAVLPRIDELTTALASAVHTDIPPSQLPAMLALAEKVDTKSLRSFVFAPPFYATERLHGDPRGYVIIPNVARIRSAVQSAFTSDPAVEATRQAIAQEQAVTWVLNGSGINGQSTAVADYLTSMGFDASAPLQRPGGAAPVATKVIAYNGAETKFPASIAFLEKLFGVKVTPVADPTQTADIVVVTASTTSVPSPAP
jgi:polyisoprenyl-teichoic acid--peptidoglycan teichoic acid transferase